MSKMNFENALINLEKIVAGLDKGDLSLEDALKSFEEGIRLSRFCSEKLDETEQKITLLMKDQKGNLIITDFGE